MPVKRDWLCEYFAFKAERILGLALVLFKLPRAEFRRSQG
jgi:hypothetical protein